MSCAWPGAPATGRRVLAPLGRGWLRNPVAGGYLRAHGRADFRGPCRRLDRWLAPTHGVQVRLSPVEDGPRLCRVDSGHAAVAWGSNHTSVVRTPEPHTGPKAGPRTRRVSSLAEK